MAVFAAMLGGMEKVAMDMVEEMSLRVNEATLSQRPELANFQESYAAITPHVLIRFGRWEAITKLAFPVNKQLMATTYATLRYARALAFAALGDTAKAEEEAAHFEAARAAPELEGRILHNNTVADTLALNAAMLKGEIEYRKGGYDAAFESLRRAVQLDDALKYDEPWGQMQPVRHALGALLFEQGHLAEAESVYRADLTRHPKNPWSLLGLHGCLQGKSPPATDLAVVRQMLDAAQQLADFDMRASCACALEDSKKRKATEQ